MNQHLFRLPLAAGGLVVAWVAAGYLNGGGLALAMTLAIGGFFVIGALELHRVDADSRALDRALVALDMPPGDPPAWLAALPAPLQEPVRQRLDGLRTPLPGPSLTPYLVGLLVLLGMLGTFLGMVVTLNGTGLALERASDLQSMRESLAAPVRGLGLAFGTSVAGVAASAMLGLASALVRRTRLGVAHRLDAALAGVLRTLGRPERQAREVDAYHAESLLLQRQQAAALPAVVEQMQALAVQQAALTAQIAAQSQQAGADLLAGQLHFQTRVEAAFGGLAASVDRTLRQSLAASARVAADTLHEATASTLAGITRETAVLHGRVADAAAQQLTALAGRLEADLQAGVDRWLATLDRQLDQAAQAQDAHLARYDEALRQMAERLAGQAEARTRAVIDEVTRLVATASDAPRAAAEVVAGMSVQLRERLGESLARDTAMLAERERVMAALNTLLAAVQHTASEQQAAIDRLVASSATWLDQAGRRLDQRAAADAERLDGVATRLAASAAEVGSLGEAFGAGVAQFGATGDRLMAHLQRVDETLARAVTRSDEQLAYYVAQAREVIDLSLTSQQQLAETLQRAVNSRAGTATAATEA